MLIGVIGSELKKGPYMRMNVAIPEEAARFLEMIGAAWGENPEADITNPPIATLDSAGHGVGESIGLVFENRIDERSRYFKEGPLFTLSSRLSYGSDQKFRKSIGVEPDVIDGWVPENMDRLHISLECHREIGVSDSSPTYTEGMLFSLRWVGGKFDDWSDPSLYEKEKKRAYPTRTTNTYAMENPGEASGFTEIHGETPRILDDQGVLIGYEGETHSPDFGLFSYAGGYDHTLALLSRFGDVDLEGTVNDLTPMKGVEFLLGKVLPAMTAFGNNNYSNG